MTRLSQTWINQPSNDVATVNSPMGDTNYAPDNYSSPEATGEPKKSIGDIAQGAIIGDLSQPETLIKGTVVAEALKFSKAYVASKYPQYLKLLQTANAETPFWGKVLKNLDFITETALTMHGFDPGSVASRYLVNNMVKNAVGKSITDPELMKAINTVYGGNHKVLDALSSFAKTGQQLAATSDQVLNQAMPGITNQLINSGATAVKRFADLEQELQSTNPQVVQEAKNSIQKLIQQNKIAPQELQKFQASNFAENNKAYNANPFAAQEEANQAGLARATQMKAAQSGLAEAENLAAKNPQAQAEVSTAISKITQAIPALSALSKFAKYLPFVGLIIQAPEMCQWVTKISAGEVDLANDAYNRAKFIGFISNFLGSITILIPPLAPVAAALGVVGIGASEGAEVAKYAGDPGSGLSLFGHQFVGESDEHKQQANFNSANMQTSLTNYPDVQLALQAGTELAKQGYTPNQIVTQLQGQYPFLTTSNNDKYALFTMHIMDIWRENRPVKQQPQLNSQSTVTPSTAPNTTAKMNDKKFVKSQLNAQTSVELYPDVEVAVNEAANMFKKGIKLRDALPQLRPKYTWLTGSPQNNIKYSLFLQAYQHQTKQPNNIINI
jgi:hypothetical protein